MTPLKRQRSLSLSSLITLFKSCCCLVLLVLNECCCSPTISLTNAERFGSSGTGSGSGSGIGISTGAGSSNRNMNRNSGSSLAYGIYGTAAGSAMRWDHAVDLNEDFRILWTIINQDVTFEIQARTLGYVGFGFSADGNQAGTDMAIGWVDRGHTFFQDRYVKQNDILEPVVDPSQDYILIFGSENATHTVLRFRRKLDTCDGLHDVAITNGTMRAMYMYSDEDPVNGAVAAGSLPNLADAWHPARSLIIAQARVAPAEPVRTLELRNEAVELPYGDDTLLWCKMFKLDKLNRKHHLVKYEPVYDSSWSMHYMQQVTLYECQGASYELEEMAREQGRACMGGARTLPLACNAIVASWSRGSDGFTFPAEAGYPLESSQAKYYLLETHYSNAQPDVNQLQTRMILDSSGLRLHLTERLRTHDAGVLSIGMDPNWRHIIPPGQKRVVSVGQCIEDCTGYAFPPQGIDIFAVMMRTHQIGREIKLRQIRQTEELPPIAHDSNIDASYQDYRRLPQAVRSLPGDRLMAECIYDSSSRNAITLGGLSMKEESCTVLTLYYPRQQKLTTCHSLPSLPTVLHSLGIEQLATNSNPVVISSPAELSGMTLEDRLLSYDWQHQFGRFQQATLDGTFKPLCWNANNEILAISKHITGHSVNISKPFVEPRRCKTKRPFATEAIAQLELPVIHDLQGNHITESGSARSSRSSIIETLALSGAGSGSGRAPERGLAAIFNRFTAGAVLLALIVAS